MVSQHLPASGLAVEPTEGGRAVREVLHCRTLPLSGAGVPPERIHDQLTLPRARGRHAGASSRSAPTDRGLDNCLPPSWRRAPAAPVAATCASHRSNRQPHARRPGPGFGVRRPKGGTVTASPDAGHIAEPHAWAEGGTLMSHRARTHRLDDCCGGRVGAVRE